MYTIDFGLLIKFLVKSYLCTSMLHSNLEQELTADFGKLVFKHFFLSLYISVATPHMLILGATGEMAELGRELVCYRYNKQSTKILNSNSLPHR